MPELPEVETTCRGIQSTILNQPIINTHIHNPNLRWPIPSDLPTHLNNNAFTRIQRRAKYLILTTPTGTLLIHLGMSGCLKIVNNIDPVKKHDHVDIVFHSGISLRYHDPRRFGCILWTQQPITQHPLLASLGVEPLEEEFNADDFHHIAQQRRCNIKQLIMNSKVVVGVGNIYANEALFLAKINPKTLSYKLSLKRCQRLINTIKTVLQQAIQAGGTTLKDFHNIEGKPGYFTQQLHVYGKEGQPCPQCKKTLKRIIMQQRTTIYCTHCQR